MRDWELVNRFPLDLRIVSRIVRKRTLQCSTVVGVRLNLGCASVRALDKKVGPYGLSLLVSSGVTYNKVEDSLIVELVRTLSKTDFCNIVDHL